MNGRCKYERKPLMKQVLKEFRVSQRAYKLPAIGNGNINYNNRSGSNIKGQAKVGNDKMHKRNCNLKDQQCEVLSQPAGSSYPPKSNIKLPFTPRMDENSDPMAKSACKSNHVLAPTLKNKMQPINYRQSSPLKTKEGFLVSSVERLNSKQIHLKPMCGLVRFVDNGGTLKQSQTYQEGGVLFRKDNNIGEGLKSLKGKNDSISKGSKLSMANELLVPNRGNSNEDNKCDKKCNGYMIDKDKNIEGHVNFGSITSSAMRGYVPPTCDDRHIDMINGNEVPNLSPLIKEKPKVHDRDDCEDHPPNKGPMKKRRMYIVESDDEESGCGDQNSIDLNNPNNVTVSVAPESSGGSSIVAHSPLMNLFGGGQDYIPLSAHLSTKSCKKVWDLSISIPSIVQMTKLSRSEVWPKSLKAPTDDNIGLYFLPHKMRVNKGMDQLVKEIVENDMTLCAVVGEARMLVFPSTLLPEKYQTFQGKHYLWGAFKRREEQQQDAVASEQQQRGSDQRCKQVGEESTKQDVASNQHDEAQHRDDPYNMQEMPAARKHAMCLGKKPQLPASEVDRHGDMVEEQRAKARAAERAPGQPHVADESIGAASANLHGRVVGLLLRQTPRLEELIREMQREGELVATMEGKMIGATTMLP
ncbi:hypothetical protein ABZP36_033843 [Zizania latifolia]